MEKFYAIKRLRRLKKTENGFLKEKCDYYFSGVINFTPEYSWSEYASEATLFDTRREAKITLIELKQKRHIVVDNDLFEIVVVFSTESIELLTKSEE